MRNVIVGLALLLGGLGTPAVAQTALQLAVTGTAVVTPDQIAASMSVQANAATAAAAQTKVNGMMAKALAAARAVPDVVATTGDYSVNAVDPAQPGQPAGFQASQELDLVMPAPAGVPSARFTTMLGHLQEAGLLLNGLNGQLSAAGQDAAQSVAVRDALRRLRTEADAVAETLGDQVQNIKTLNVQTGGAGPVRPMVG